MRRLLAIMLSFAPTALLALSACGGSDEPIPSLPGAARPTAVLAPDSITAAQLAGEFDLDSVAADAKFKGKTLDVTGSVISLGTNKSKVSYINLQGAGYGDDAGTAVQCVLTESDSEALSELSPMEVVTIRGTVEGLGDSVKDTDDQFALFIATGLDLTIGDCSVVR